jgi:integrase
MEYLGHSSIRTTMDIYGHVMPSTQQMAASKIDALLNEDHEME